MHQDAGAEGYIWLRQAVWLQVGNQQRTLEIGIPVRPGATPEEIERLLQEAGAGMEQLTRHLDARIAALVTGDVAAATSALGGVGAPDGAARASTPARIAGGPVSEADAAAEVEAAAQLATTARPAAFPAPTTAAPTHVRPGVREGGEAPAAPAQRPPVTAPTAPDPPGAARLASAGGQSATTSATPSTTARPTQTPQQSAAPQSAGATSGPELSRRDFLAATNALGLKPPQVMERLGVRSLDGLNLREALDVVRRQMQRESGDVGDSDHSAPHATARPAPAQPGRTRPGPSRFDEEEDFDAPGAIDEDELTEIEAGGEEGALREDLAADLEEDDLLDEGDLDEVPDFEAPPPAAVRAQQRTAARAPRAPVARLRPDGGQHDDGAKSGAHLEAGAGAPERLTLAASGPLSLPQRARARDRLTALRATPNGGTPTPMQMRAFANVVESQLGKESAVALTQGLWGTLPARTGADRLNGLIQWGKEDDFAEVAPLVVALVRSGGIATARTGDGAATGPSEPPTRARRPGAEPGGDS
jgi:hypothetical protein